MAQKGEFKKSTGLMVKQIMRSSSEPNSMFAEYKRAEIYISCGDSMAEVAVVKEG